MATEFDFQSGVDPTALTNVTGAQLKQLVDAGAPRSHIGFIIEGATAPDVANNARYSRYIWKDTSGASPVFKRYRASDLTWQPINAEYLTDLIETVIDAALPGAIAGLDLDASNLPLITYATIADMLAQDSTVLQSSFLAIVQGYNAQNDLGGGVFYYDALSAVDVDFGSAFEPNDTIGRWLRIRPEKPRPEHFDDVMLTADEKINNCLRAYGICHLAPATTYELEGSILLDTGNAIVGDGPTSIVQLIGIVDADADNIFYLFDSVNLALAKNDIKLEGFQINCGYNAQTTKATSIGAFRCVGARHTLRDLTISNFNIGSDDNAIGVIESLLLSTQGDANGLICDNVRFNSPGDTTAIAVTSALTLIKAGGAGSWNGVSYVASYAKDVQVTNCHVAGFTRNATTQKSKLRFFETQFLTDGIVSDNTLSTFAGPCVYLQRWPVSQLTVVDNKFINVLLGVVLTLATGTTERPLYTDINILNNYIKTLGNADSNEFVARGIWLNSEWPQGGYAGYSAFNGIIIRGNHINAQTYVETGPTTRYPSGIYIGNGTSATPLTNIYIDGNLFDVPTQDAADTANFNEAYSRSIMFVDEDGWNADQINLGIGNRRKDGKQAYLGLVETGGAASERVYCDDVQAATGDFDTIIGLFTQGGLHAGIADEELIEGTAYDLYAELDKKPFYYLSDDPALGSGTILLINLPPDIVMAENEGLLIRVTAAGSATAVTFRDNDGNTVLATGVIDRTWILIFQTGGGTNNWITYEV